ncbi:hypothetical protein [Amycolatopsis sp. NPDC051128]
MLYKAGEAALNQLMRSYATRPSVVDVLEAEAGTPGLRFLDRHGKPVPW